MTVNVPYVVCSLLFIVVAHIAAREKFVVNEEFEEKPRSDLLDPSLAGWVHHAQFILPQGRCRWLNPLPAKEADEEDEEDAEAEPVHQAEPETGPPLLQPLQNDEGSCACCLLVRHFLLSPLFFLSSMVVIMYSHDRD